MKTVTVKDSSATPTGEVVQAALPFTFAGANGFKSKTKLPAGGHGRTCSYAVQRIVTEGESKRAQALATLLPVEREFVTKVVDEYRKWAAEKAQKEQAE